MALSSASSQVKDKMDDQEKNAPPKTDAEEPQSKKILKHSSSFAQFSIVAASGICTAAFSVEKDVKLHRHILAAGGCFLVLSYLSAILLLYLKMFLSERRELNQVQIRIIQILCLFSGAMLVATNSLLLLLVKEGNGLLALNLLPVQAIIGVLAYRATPTQGSLRDEAFAAAMKSGRKVALFASATAFAVQTTLVFGYLNNSNFQGLGGHRLDISVSFLASALSVMLVVATCMPLGYRTQAARGTVLSLLRYLKDAVIAALALTAVTLGQEFLGSNAMLALFPEIAVAAIYYGVTLRSESDENAIAVRGQQQGDDVEHKTMEVLPTAVVATFCFSMLGAAYAALFGTPEYSVYTKALVFTLLAAVMSSLGKVVGPLSGSRRDKNTAEWVVFLSNILPIVEMLVAVLLAAKVIVDFIPAA